MAREILLYVNDDGELSTQRFVGCDDKQIRVREVREGEVVLTLDLQPRIIGHLEDAGPADRRALAKQLRKLFGFVWKAGDDE